ncbi:MAG: Mur ligase family protein, partial [Candidatus Dadabacteria bacterium]|nr:Mur ligase family protein [Candidatus Dadabacteria bacterium]
ENFTEQNTFCVNIDDPRVKKVAERTHCRKITYGVKSPEAFIRADEIMQREMKSVEFTMHIGRKSSRARIRGIGSHNVSNALSASALAYSLGCGMDQIVAGLEKHVPTAMRLEDIRTPSGFRIINDSYNANPDSMRVALDELAAQRKNGSKAVAVLGDMLELGESSEMEHRLIGEHISQLGLDMVVVTGEFSKPLVSTVPGETVCHVAKNPKEVAALLAELCAENDVILVKGSRGMKMEMVIHALCEK